MSMLTLYRGPSLPAAWAHPAATAGHLISAQHVPSSSLHVLSPSLLIFLMSSAQNCVGADEEPGWRGELAVGKVVRPSVSPLLVTRSKQT